MTDADLAALAQGAESADGNCFIVATILSLSNPAAFLCQGVGIGRGTEAGVPYWHAWVEVDDPAGDGETMCVDRANGHDVVMLASAYYDLQQLSNVTRYTQAETVNNVRRTGKLGPWLADGAREANV